MSYILEFTLSNSKVHTVVEAQSKKAAISAAFSFIGALQNTQDLQVHPAIKMLTSKTPAKVEKWDVKSNRKTYSARKEFLVYYVSNGIISAKEETGNGIKSAYLNFKEMQKKINANMGGYKIRVGNAVIIIDMSQQLTEHLEKEFKQNHQKEKEIAEKIWIRLSKQANELRKGGSNFNILVLKHNTLYWIYKANGKNSIKVVIDNDQNKMDLIRASVKGLSLKKFIDADAIIVSRDFVDHVELKCGPDGPSALYQSIKGNLIIGVHLGTKVGQELKDYSIIAAMFEIDDGRVWSQKKSIQEWQNILKTNNSKVRYS